MNVIAAWCNRMKPVSDARGLVSMNRVGASCCVSRTLIHLIILLSAATGCVLGQSPGTFTATGSMTIARAYHQATLLADGRVLITGGTSDPNAPAEIYDPSTGTFTVSGVMSTTGTFSPTGGMPNGSVLDGTASILLTSGKILSTGGMNYDFGPQPDAELYDPGTGVVSSTGPMLFGRAWHTLTLLPDGKVLAAGGMTAKCGPSGCYYPWRRAPAELYDPASGTFSATGNMISDREGHTATLLNDGRVLLTGGHPWWDSLQWQVPTASAELYTPLLLPTVPPSVSGVQSISLFGGSSAVAPGSWIEVHGSNLAGAFGRSWTLADFNGVVAPTSLDLTSVAIGGQPAAIASISSTMLLVQVPSQVGPGSQPLVVTTAAGTTATSPFTVTVNPLEPGVYAPGFLLVGGNQYTSEFNDFMEWILPTGASAGTSSRPARPGDFIVVWGVGFGPVTSNVPRAGPVTSNVPTGTIVQGLTTLNTPVQFSIGGVPATVLYQGLAPGQIGLYQFDLVVPNNVGAGNLVPLTFTQGGVSGTQKLFVAIQP